MSTKQQIEETVIDIITRAEQYKRNNDISILSSGDLNKWFLPESVEAIDRLVIEARLAEMEYWSYYLPTFDWDKRIAELQSQLTNKEGE